jgi:hypothetical protein
MTDDALSRVLETILEGHFLSGWVAMRSADKELLERADGRTFTRALGTLPGNSWREVRLDDPSDQELQP